MPRYHVQIIEFLGSTVTVEAESEEEAEKMVKDGDFNEEDQSERMGIGEGCDIVDCELAE